MAVCAIATYGSDVASYDLAVHNAHRTAARRMVRSGDIARRHTDLHNGIDIEIVAVLTLQLHIVAVANRTVIRPLATRRGGTFRIVKTDAAEDKGEYDYESAHNSEGKDMKKLGIIENRAHGI